MQTHACYWIVPREICLYFAVNSLFNELYRDEQCFLDLLVAPISYRKETFTNTNPRWSFSELLQANTSMRRTWKLRELFYINVCLHLPTQMQESRSNVGYDFQSTRQCIVQWKTHHENTLELMEWAAVTYSTKFLHILRTW